MLQTATPEVRGVGATRPAGPTGDHERVGVRGRVRADRWETRTVNQAFEISNQSVGDATLVSVSGEIDISTAPSLRAELQEHAPEDTMVIVDLKRVTFLDSTALGVLVGARRNRIEAGGDLRLVVSEPRILKIFEITGLTDVFSISPSLDEAMGW
jgi:anti-sigma B factor antagonist